MRRSLLLVVCLLVVVATAVAVGGCIETPTVTGVPAGGGENLGIIWSQQNTGIWVTGEGKITVAPDVAILNLGVEAQATTVAQAQREAAGAMDAIVKELKDKGVADKDIRTQQYSIYAVRVYDKGKETIVGYRVTNMVTAKIRKIGDAGTIIDAVAKVGGDYLRIGSISFSVDDPTVYYGQVREKAITDAKAKAKQMADLTGVGLGKPIYISEGSPYYPTPRSYDLKGAEGAAAPPTPISPGETEIRLSVQIVYGIK